MDSRWPVVGRGVIAAKSFVNRLPVMRYRLGKHCDMFSMPSGPCKLLPEEVRSADIINLHWVSMMIDLPTFFASISPSSRVVWTLHDMNAFTGGCHYSGPCVRYHSRCGRCPELNSTRDGDLSFQNFCTKQAVFSTLRPDQLTIVTPSRWLQQCVTSSELLGNFRAVRIPYGIDTNAFVPLPQQDARDALGVPVESQVLLFVAGHLGNYRKGIDLLIAALSRIESTQPLTLLVIGQLPEEELRLPEHVRLRVLGFLSEERRIAQAYAAADVFVIPSRQDNLPNTILESLACGTPVVGFRVGGIPDLVIDGETGFCAEPEDVESLSRAISSALETRGGLRDRCRELITAKYSLKTQATQYLNLFREISTGNAPQTSGV